MRRVTCLLAISAGLVLALGDGLAAGPVDDPGFVKAFSCSACHGPGGASPSDTVPILAGMPAAYFRKALEDYAGGKRVSPEMEAYARLVIQLGLDDLAGYFARQAFRPSTTGVDPPAVARGRAASAECAVCHGNTGRGDPAKLIPALAGQPPGYLRNQMLLFKRDQRSPGDAHLKAMKTLMRTIPDETLSDLAAYYSSLR
jgi:cytochrome c553